MVEITKAPANIYGGGQGTSRPAPGLTDIYYEKKLKEWFDVHTQSMFLRGEGRKLQFQQWQDLLKKGWGTDMNAPGYTPGNGVGNWEIYQDSEITGDERCRNIFKVSLSLPQAKFAFINSQSLDQLTVGQAKDTDEIGRAHV